MDTRCRCTSVDTSTPGVTTANASFITSSSRPRCSGNTGVRHHCDTSAWPAAVSSHATGESERESESSGTSCSEPSTCSIKPSRCSRCNVVDTCPMFSGHMLDVVRSNRRFNW